VSKVKARLETKGGKRKMSEVSESEDSEGEEPLAKKVKLRSVIGDSNEESE
jgi:hypothetical protein